MIVKGGVYDRAFVKGFFVGISLAPANRLTAAVAHCNVGGYSAAVLFKFQLSERSRGGIADGKGIAFAVKGQGAALSVIHAV